MNPTIGITTSCSDDWEYWYRSYANAVEAWGAKALPITHDLVAERGANNLVEELGGLLLSGGLDVALSNYPNPPDTGGESLEEFEARHHMTVSLERDEYEFPLITRALEAGLPILGICRGIQVLNVVLGGRLVLHIPGEELGDVRIEHRALPAPGTETPDISGSHSILVTQGSRLGNALAPSHLTVVNSCHHQGIRREDLAEGLEAVAISPEDGLIEAVESLKHRWVIAVQWHPERIGDRYIYDPCRPLFRSFVDACRLTRSL